MNTQTYQKESHSDSGKSDIAGILTTEYENMHARVFHQVDSYNSNNVKILMLVGVLLYFGITFFYKTEPQYALFVDLVFILVLPFFASCAIALAAANLCKIMILGDYLMVIETKVNKVFKEEAEKYGFEGNQEYVLGWEYWRVKYGNAQKGNAFAEVSFTFIIIFVDIVVSILCAIIRLDYIRTTIGNPDIFIRGVCFIASAAVVFLLVCGWSAYQILCRRKNADRKVDNIYKGFDRDLTSDDRYH